MKVSFGQRMRDALTAPGADGQRRQSIAFQRSALVLWRLCQPGSSDGSTFPNEPRHQLDMRRVPELVDGSHALKGVAAIDQDPGVARKACYIARYRRQSEGKRPDAAKQIGNVLGPLAMFRDQRSQRFLAGGGGLQE